MGDLGATGWFQLPSLLPVGGLVAAGGDAIVLEASSPGGVARFLVRSRGSVRPDYSLELVLRRAEAAGPLMAAVSYVRPDGGKQLLLVPVARGRFGPPAAYIRLPGFAVEIAWMASIPVAVQPNPGWEAETIVASIRAALNEATREAWRQVGELVAADLSRVIAGALAG